MLRDQLRELEADLSGGAIGQAAFQDAHDELTRRVAQEVQPQPAAPHAGAMARWQAIAIGAAIVLGAAILYAALGTPAALRVQHDPALLTAGQAEVMVERLALHLQTDPGNARGWLLLARSRGAMKQYAQAELAYARLAALTPDAVPALVEYAELLSVAQGKTLQGEPSRCSGTRCAWSRTLRAHFCCRAAPSSSAAKRRPLSPPGGGCRQAMATRSSLPAASPMPSGALLRPGRRQTACAVWSHSSHCCATRPRLTTLSSSSPARSLAARCRWQC